jgi:hypothetical protein
MVNRELELFCSFILLIYGINYWYGRRENHRIAHDWLDLVKQVVADNFAKIGTNNQVRGPTDVIFQ